MFFAVQVQTGRENELLSLFLLENSVAVAIPGCCERLRAVVVEELLQDFFPTEFAHDVFVELGPVVAEQFLVQRERNCRGGFTRAVKPRMKNLLRGNRRLFEHAGQSGPAGVFQDSGRKSKSSEIGKN